MKYTAWICFLTLLSTVSAQAAPPEKMVLIPAGKYIMGDAKSAGELNVMDILNPDRHALGPEDPAHAVELDAFYIDVHEVTNQDYQEYTKAAGAQPSAFADNPDFNGSTQPVVGITWKEAAQFCEWKKKRLPTEAEWEKAARGQRQVKYPWGNEPPDDTRANFMEKVGKTMPVGSYEAGKSDYGVYDLSGNVSEWTSDWHDAEYFIFSPPKNPQGPEKGKYKVVRGGNWMNNAEDIRLTYRGATVPKLKAKTTGFRCAMDAPAETK